jgi:hypothetical protein
LAVDTLSNLNTFNDSIVAEREKITKPLNDALKEVRSRYKPIESSLTSAIELIRTKMSEYQTAVTLEAKKKEVKLASQLSTGDISMDAAMQALSVTPAPADSIWTGAGKVKFKTVQKVKILSIKDLSDYYKIPNESLILADLKAGKVVSGALLEEVQVPVNYR